MPTIMCKLAAKRDGFPDGVVPITCSDADVEWIQKLPILLGANNHPTAPPDDPSTHDNRELFKSLARRVLHRHGAPADDEDYAYRVDTGAPLDVSHDNICVPPRHVAGYSFMADCRSIPLSDYLVSFPPGQEFTFPEEDPTMFYCIHVEANSVSQILIVGDKDDREWLEHRQVKLTPSGKLLYQNDQMKFVPVLFEQARRSLGLSNEDHPHFHFYNEVPSTDIRKCNVVVRVANRLYRGMRKQA